MDQKLEAALAEIRARISQIDPMLVRLISFSLHGNAVVQYGIAVRLGGATIFGVPSLSQTTGEDLDNQTLRAIQLMHAIQLTEGGEHGDWPEAEKAVRESAFFTTQAKSDDEASAKLQDKITEAGFEDAAKLSDLPEDLAYEAAVTIIPPKALTLTKATIQKDNGNTEKVSSIRINLSLVEAWWTFELSPAPGTEEAFTSISGSQEPNGGI